jgi:ABC-type sulfate/molybdate transport systems ATPase subunit
MTSRLHRQRGLTTLCVTHHIDDALIAADRLLVVEAGAVLAFAPPGELARHPPTREIARLLQMGTVFDDPRGTCWYLLPHEFITDRIAAEALKRPVQVPLPDASVQFLGTCQMVRETTSGRIFRIPADARFQGELFFDSATTWKLPGAVAGT